MAGLQIELVLFTYHRLLSVLDWLVVLAGIRGGLLPS